MTLQTGTTRETWRHVLVGALAGGAVAVSLVTGITAPNAFAQPTEPTTTEAPTPTPEAEGPKTPCTGDDCNNDEEAAAAAAPTVSADQVLATIHNEYAQGDGGGQISKLIDDAMKLRQQGFRPSNAHAADLAKALEFRPNQTPLVEALKETIAYQRKLQARAQQAVIDNGPIAGPVPVIPGMTMPVG
jgi:hypothetical protein